MGDYLPDAHEVHSPAVQTVESGYVSELAPTTLEERFPELQFPNDICKHKPTQGEAGERQQLLDEIEKEHPSPYVACILYDPDGILLSAYVKKVIEGHLPDIDKGVADAFKTRLEQLTDAGSEEVECVAKRLEAIDSVHSEAGVHTMSTGYGKVPVFVFQEAFHQSDERQKAYLIGILEDHEYVHATHSRAPIQVGSKVLTQDMVWQGIVGYSTFYLITESQADMATIEYFSNHPLFGPQSEEYLGLVALMRAFNEGLEAIYPSAISNLEKQLILSQKVQNSLFLRNHPIPRSEDPDPITEMAEQCNVSPKRFTQLVGNLVRAKLDSKVEAIYHLNSQKDASYEPPPPQQGGGW